MMILLMMSVLGAMFVQTVRAQEDPGSHKGTTEHIEAVFEGRCWDYDVTKYNNLLPRVEADCDNLWQEFSKAFSFKSPCDVTQAQYEEFLDSTKQTLPLDKVMFWSGVYTLSHKFAENGVRFITLEDTMIGYLANSLTWCGQETAPGMNFTRCPDWADCSQEASESFWAGASTTFATQAKGEVTIMVDGSNPDKPAYRTSSFFGKYELPNLDVAAVMSVNVIVSHALDKPKIEVCGQGSLLDLQNDVTARGLIYTCIDDPDSVMHLLCSDDPDSRECQLAQFHAAGKLQVTDPPRGFNQMPRDMLS
uniref:Uncharacterized protein n=1 Tax=Arion vulgaris TaxID=1028688 RepID=A0A0B6YAT0_9EUPU